MYEQIRKDLTRKLLGLKLWLKELKADDQISKGLYFVYIYGIYEKTVTDVVLTTIEQLNSLNLDIGKCNYDLYSMIFSSEYDSIYGAGNSTKWQKRWKISHRLKIGEKVNIPLSIMPTDGKNFRKEQLQSIANSFGVTDSVVPDLIVGGHLQELVNNRNYIAHGDKTPSEVGGGYSLVDLYSKNQIYEGLCNYVIDLYKTYIDEKQYLRTGN